MTPICTPLCHEDCSHLDASTARLLGHAAVKVAAHWASLGDWGRAEAWSRVASGCLPQPPAEPDPVTA